MGKLCNILPNDEKLSPTRLNIIVDITLHSSYKDAASKFVTMKLPNNFGLSLAMCADGFREKSEPKPCGGTAAILLHFLSSEIISLSLPILIATRILPSLITRNSRRKMMMKFQLRSAFGLLLLAILSQQLLPRRAVGPSPAR